MSSNSASAQDLMCKQYPLVVLTNAKHFWAWASAESGLSFIHSSKSPTASSTWSSRIFNWEVKICPIGYQYIMFVAADCWGILLILLLIVVPNTVAMECCRTTKQIVRKYLSEWAWLKFHLAAMVHKHLNVNWWRPPQEYHRQQKQTKLHILDKLLLAEMRGTAGH